MLPDVTDAARPESGGTPRPIALYTKTWLSSGAGLFAQALAAGMAESGDILFIAPDAEAPRWEEPRPGLRRIRSWRGTPASGRLGRMAASVRRVASGWSGVLRARRQARVFVVTIPDPLVFVLPLLAVLRLTGAHILYVVHDPLPHVWKLPSRFRFLERGAYDLAYRLSDGLITLSGPSAEALAAAFPVNRPIAVIEHGVFPLDAPPDPLPGSGQLLLFGTLRRNKSICEAIEGVVLARAAGARATLLVAGCPDEDDRGYWEACIALAARHPEAVRLEAGYVSDAALEQLVAASDAFLMPYAEFHSQSGVAILAASNARPLIATAAGGIAALIAEGLPACTIPSPVTARGVADAILAFEAVPAAAWSARAMAYREELMRTRAWNVIGRHYVELARRVAP